MYDPDQRRNLMIGVIFLHTAHRQAILYAGKKFRRTHMSFVTNIEKKTQENTNFRTVLYTAAHSQLVVMSLLPNEDIGMEVHQNVDQFIRIEKGVGKAILDGVEYELSDGTAVVVTAGTNHNFINTSATETMKLYTVYSPANHPDGTIHVTKEEAEEAEKAEHHA